LKLFPKIIFFEYRNEWIWIIRKLTIFQCTPVLTTTPPKKTSITSIKPPTLLQINSNTSLLLMKSTKNSHNKSLLTPSLTTAPQESSNKTLLILAGAINSAKLINLTLKSPEPPKKSFTVNTGPEYLNMNTIHPNNHNKKIENTSGSMCAINPI
jgi:hypothetical protein